MIRMRDLSAAAQRKVRTRAKLAKKDAKPKFNNRFVTEDGLSFRSKAEAKDAAGDGSVFDSKREWRRWQALKASERHGLIRNLRRQVRYPLFVNGQMVCAYVADFVYDTKVTKGDGDQWWLEVVEDTKGHRTREFVIKKKLMRAIHGIVVQET